MKVFFIVLLSCILLLVGCSNNDENEITDTTTEKVITTTTENVTQVIEEDDTILKYILNEDKSFNEEKVKEYAFDTYKSTTGENYYVLQELNSNNILFVTFLSTDDLHANTIEITTSFVLMMSEYWNQAKDSSNFGSMSWNWCDSLGNPIAFYNLMDLGFGDGYKDYANKGIIFKDEEYKKYCDENGINYELLNMQGTLS